jgi:hypothetical protein
MHKGETALGTASLKAGLVFPGESIMDLTWEAENDRHM